MHFGYGLITCQRHPRDPRSDAELYRDAVRLAERCEDAGFDSVWLSEHHFLDDGYMPSLLPVAAAVAQATERIEIGTGVLLAPLHDPLRLAEDAATVELLSQGRLILGIGAGWRPEEFEVFGVGLDERAARMRETVAILRKAWEPGPFDHDGRHHRFEQVNVTPKPAQPIPVWMGGFAEAAIRRAGRIGDGFLGSSSGTRGLDAFVRARDIALEGLSAAGRDPADFTFALHIPVYCSTGDDPWDEIRDHYHYLRWKYPDMAGARGRSGPAPEPPALGPEDEEKLRSTIVCGSPDEVTRGLRPFREELGDDVHLVCRSDFPGLPLEREEQLIALLAREVFPALRG